MIEHTGISLREEHKQAILENAPMCSSMELLVDNYLESFSPSMDMFSSLACKYEMSFHCLEMNLGGCDDLALPYLKNLKKYCDEIDPYLISDHLSFCRMSGHEHFDLVPIKYTERELIRIAERIDQVQNLLKRPIGLENISRYVAYNEQDMSEIQFLKNLQRMTSCEVLLDVNNLLVSAFNLDEDLDLVLEDLNGLRVKQIHMAGHTSYHDCKIDHHGSMVSLEVLTLFGKVLDVVGRVPSIIEWDQNIPTLEELLNAAQALESYLISAEPRKLENEEAIKIQSKPPLMSEETATNNPEYSLFKSAIVNSKERAKIYPYLKPELRLKHEKGIEIYFRNYIMTAVDNLSTLFERTYLQLGKENFQYFVREYVLSQYESFTELKSLEHGFPSFLEQREELQSTPWIAFLASVELLWNNCDLSSSEGYCFELGFDLMSLWKNPETEISEIDGLHRQFYLGPDENREQVMIVEK
ncbi:MAG: DUF692 domain-containing protein [Oligoflexales bacterium]|nr:DUF692 domain-containing protein [Oligoflexales bacterium]